MSHDLARVDLWASSGNSAFHKASALSKLLFVALVLGSILSSSSPVFLAGLYAALCGLVLLSRVPLGPALVLSLYPVLFSALWLLSRWNGDWTLPLVLVLRSLASSLTAVLLVASTPYPDLFAPIARVTPRLVGDGLFLTYRAFFLLVARADRMWTALRLRGGLSGRGLPRDFAPRAGAGAARDPLLRPQPAALCDHAHPRPLGARLRLPPLGGVLGVRPRAARVRGGRGGPALLDGGTMTEDLAVRLLRAARLRRPHAGICAARLRRPEGPARRHPGAERQRQVDAALPHPRLLEPNEGDVSVFGVNPARSFNKIRERVGVVLQNVDEQILADGVGRRVVLAAQLRLSRARGRPHGRRRARGGRHHAPEGQGLPPALGRREAQGRARRRARAQARAPRHGRAVRGARPDVEERPLRAAERAPCEERHDHGDRDARRARRC